MLHLSSVQYRRGALVLLAGLALWSFSYRLGAAPLLDDPNEAEYAEVAREMVETGDWISPQLNYVVFLNKPPLTSWLIGLSDLAFGVNEFAARLPGVLAGLVIVLLVVRLGTRLYDADTGLLAGCVLLATGGFFVETHLVRPDLVLTASLVGSLAALAALLAPAAASGRRRTRWPLLGLQASLAVGVLTKGLLGLVLPGLVCGVLIVVERRFDIVAMLLHPRAWWVFLLLVVPWHVAMAVKHPGFLWDYVVNQHVLVFFDRKLPRDSVPVSLPVFWGALAARVFPWTIFVPLALLVNVRGMRAGVLGDRLVLAWAASVLFFFSAAAARMEHYSIPALPAFALLTARMFRDPPSARTHRLLAGHVVAAGLLICSGVFIVPWIVATQPWLAPVKVFPALARWGFGLLGAGALLALVVALWGGMSWAPLGLVAGFLAAVPVVGRGLVALAPVDSSAGMATALRALADPGERLVYDAPVEYQRCAGFDFYVRRRLTLLRPAALTTPPTYLAPHLDDLFIDHRQLVRLWRDERVFLITAASPTVAGLRGIAPEPFYIVARDRLYWLVTNRPLH